MEKLYHYGGHEIIVTMKDGKRWHVTDVNYCEAEDDTYREEDSIFGLLDDGTAEAFYESDIEDIEVIR